MQPDADRFRPRDSGPISEQSPPAAGDGGPEREPAPPAARQRPPRPQHYAPPQYGAPQYGAPQYGAPQHRSGTYGAGQFGGRRYGPAQLPQAYPPPQGARLAPPPFEGRDAPLIHPAAAQASSAIPYGIPVYQAPVYAYAPQPQRGLSITALVLGLCSFLFAWTLVVVPVIGVVFGFIALRREPAGKAMAIIGLVASLVGLLWVLLFYMLPLIGVLGAMLYASGG